LINRVSAATPTGDESADTVSQGLNGSRANGVKDGAMNRAAATLKSVASGSTLKVGEVRAQ